MEQKLGAISSAEEKRAEICPDGFRWINNLPRHYHGGPDQGEIKYKASLRDNFAEVRFLSAYNSAGEPLPELVGVYVKDKEATLSQ